MIGARAARVKQRTGSELHRQDRASLLPSRCVCATRRRPGRTRNGASSIILLDFRFVLAPPPRPATRASRRTYESMSELWRRIVARLETELSAQDMHTYVAPLQANEQGGELCLFAPNAYTLEAVRTRFLERIRTLVGQSGTPLEVIIRVGSSAKPATKPATAGKAASRAPQNQGLDPHYRFENFVEGKSNQLGKAAAMQVAMNPGSAYNPLLLYGGTGLGKTHLMHAAGNLMCVNKPDTQVLCLRSEQFVTSMVRQLAEKN